MLTLEISGGEIFDEETNTFRTTKSEVLRLEHSLLSLSKWEANWEEPFISPKDKTTEQTLDYVRCMCLDEKLSEETLHSLQASHFKQISDYLDKKMTATWFNDPASGKGGSGETITAELIYYWMVALNIPLETQFWHLNRLITLIKVTNLKNAPPKKMGRSEQAAQNRRLNEQRKQMMKTSG